MQNISTNRYHPLSATGDSRNFPQLRHQNQPGLHSVQIARAAGSAFLTAFPMEIVLQRQIVCPFTCQSHPEHRDLRGKPSNSYFPTTSHKPWLLHVSKAISTVTWEEKLQNAKCTVHFSSEEIFPSNAFLLSKCLRNSTEPNVPTDRGLLAPFAEYFSSDFHALPSPQEAQESFSSIFFFF